jgi:hypothetical protein
MHPHLTYRPAFAVALVGAVALAFFGIPNTARATCMPRARVHAVSDDGAVELHVEGHPGKAFKITRDRNVVAAGELDIDGHHITGFIPDSGTFFVLHDRYDGVTLYDRGGRRLAHFTPGDLLSVRESMLRPGKWACHPEGEWSSGSDAVSFNPDGRSITVRTHSGREIVIDVESASVTGAGYDLAQGAILVAAVLLGFGALACLGWIASRRPRLAHLSSGAQRERLEEKS